MKRTSLIVLGGLSLILQACSSPSLAGPPDPQAQSAPAGSGILADHRTANLQRIPAEAIQAAVKKLVIAYGHTSHGSQVVDGLQSLQKSTGQSYPFGGPNGLRLLDSPFQGAADLGNPDMNSWSGATERFLRGHPEVNVVMWSWCGQVSGASSRDIENYLSRMTALENSFPKVRFVYMTGHLDGSGPNGNLHQRNEQIRAFCRANGKALFDFADIERFDPDGNDYLSRGANDNCDYNGGNWAQQWQSRNPGKWFECSPAHSQPLNGNLKAYAAWHLFARLAGWKG